MKSAKEIRRTTSSGNWRLTTKRLIICEGDNDKHFLQALIKANKLGTFQVGHADECNNGKGGGRSGFGHALKGLELFKAFDKLTGIGIVTDNDHKGVLSEIQKNLRKKAGVIIESGECIGKLGDKPVIIILLPDDYMHGNLESFCLPILYETWPRAEKCLMKCLACTEADKWKKQDKLYKAKVRAIISGHHMDDPYMTLGLLFKRKILPADHPRFARLVDILRRFDEIAAKCEF